MNLEKAKKRIAHQVKKGFKGYPVLTITYLGKTADVATKVVVEFLETENSEPQTQSFESDVEIREDETIQSVLVKIIERANASTVDEISTVKLIDSAN